MGILIANYLIRRWKSVTRRFHSGCAAIILLYSIFWEAKLIISRTTNTPNSLLIICTKNVRQWENSVASWAQFTELINNIVHWERYVIICGIIKRENESKRDTCVCVCRSGARVRNGLMDQLINNNKYDLDKCYTERATSKRFVH